MIRPQAKETLKPAGASGLDLHVWLESPPLQVQSWLVDKVRANHGLGQVRVNSRDTIRYVGMNLAVPPFDDIHVRKAVHYVINKRALIAAYGGELAALVATHIAPDSLENNALADYDPYRTADYQGSLDQAAQEMRQSRYDLEHTGTCSAAVCNHILTLGINSLANEAGPEFLQMATIIANGLSKIGITVNVQSPVGSVLTLASDPMAKVPLVLTLGGGKSYLNASSVFIPAFTIPAAPDNGGSLCKPWCSNTRVGATPDELRQWGYIPSPTCRASTAGSTSAHLGPSSKQSAGPSSISTVCKFPGLRPNRGSTG